MHLYQNHSLLNYNTFGLDVKTKYFLEFDSEEDLIDILKQRLVRENPLLVVGQGSNLLFLNDFDGVVLHSAIRGIQTVEEIEDAVLIEVGSGVIWDDLVGYCVKQGWSGIENLSLIPGETGAAAIQNIGAYGVEIKDVVQKVKTIRIADGQSSVFEQEACHYAYRESVFKKELKGQFIVTSVIIRLSKKPVFNLSYNHLEKEVLKNGTMNLENIRNTIIRIRESKLPDPKVLGNAGSFFMNPVVKRERYEALQLQYPDMPHYFVSEQEEKIPAGWLIEQCGWKGRTIGNVGVHAKQALVLINCGGAKGKEIAELAAMIQQSVAGRFGINLIPEVNFIS
ncbi:UDP-N-acetylenolpyruvoylglucosamine reductase [bioreactor metagenome]|uniref:UDP-N-acetylmuramate dehydrogenase n=1 Tax=bioreactor metagenome TaxID=1076179 RepID=A0A644VNX0_9ZZZZ|nr:UDP-N-acetylmuramate dehydrogenase [Paludibacter sp.]